MLIVHNIHITIGPLLGVTVMLGVDLSKVVVYLVKMLHSHPAVDGKGGYMPNINSVSYNKLA